MHCYTLTVIGEASQKIVAEFHLTELEHATPQGLMGWLRQQKVPIASSCYGDGVCRRCKITDQDKGEILSCLTTLEELFNKRDKATIFISYL